MNVNAAYSLNSTQQPGQVQVAVVKKSEELQKQNVLQLINSVAGVTAGAATPANPPGVGRNLNVVA